ncbi:MAG TPA: sugar transferase [Allosphingosinicella sp.]|nr:sugar transferase [Allosphingosinicella sp.]
MTGNQSRSAGLDGKRLFDIVASLALLILFCIPMAGVALAVAVKLGRPILFRQIRPGMGGQPFQMVKFRTLTDARGPDGELLEDSERVTPFGRKLRSTSLDELPELWNVLRGDMSLVGPRPLLMRYLPLYSPEQARRHDVRPGLTGWTAVKGRNALGWDEKLALDIWYVDNRSFLLDLKILAMTAAKVLSRSGVAAEGFDTAPEFRGSQAEPAPDRGPANRSPADRGA